MSNGKYYYELAKRENLSPFVTKVSSSNSELISSAIKMSNRFGLA